MLFIKKIFMLLLIISLLGLSACGGGSNLSNKGKNVSSANWTVANFQYKDQEGRPFGLADLKGKVWLAAFIFTSCNTVCPVITAHMAEIQDRLKQKGMNVPFVSFTVDPMRDTPEKLKAFGQKHNVDFSSWHFLTGYTFEEIKKLSMKSFKSAIAKPAKGSDQFTHGTNIYLIKSDKIIKYYNGVSNTPYEAIVHDIRVLTGE